MYALQVKIGLVHKWHARYAITGNSLAGDGTGRPVKGRGITGVSILLVMLRLHLSMPS